MVGLMATSSKRTYATCCTSQVHCSQIPSPHGKSLLPFPPQETLKHSDLGLTQPPYTPSFFVILSLVKRAIKVVAWAISGSFTQFFWVSLSIHEVYMLLNFCLFFFVNLSFILVGSILATEPRKEEGKLFFPLHPQIDTYI